MTSLDIGAFLQAARRLRRSPGFSTVAIGTLATAIAAAATVFAIFDAVLLRKPAFADPDRLALVWERTDASPAARGRVEAPIADRIGKDAGRIEAVTFVADARDGVLEAAGRSDHIRLGLAAGNLFELLGVGAVAGRAFRSGEGLVPADAPSDGATSVPGVMVLTDAFWAARFGRDPDIIGRNVRVDGADYTVTGVAPAGFAVRLPPDAGIDTDVDAWIALRVPLADLRRADRLRDQDTDNTGAVIARLADGADINGASLELDALARRLREEDAERASAGTRFSLVPLTRDATAHMRPALLAVATAVLLALLVACLNVAGLLVARATARRREMAVRSALGAAPGRLAAQILLEAALLAMAAGLTGLLLAGWALDFVRGFAPAATGIGDASLGGTALLFTTAAAAFTWLMAGGVSVATLPLHGDAHALRGRGTGSASGGRLRRVLAVGQIAVSLALLVGAGLLLRTFESLGRIDPGFRTDNLLTFELTMPGGSVGGPAARSALMRRIADRIGDVPGVTGVGLTGGLPLAGERFTQPVGLDGEAIEDWDRRQANFRVVSSGYFDAIGTRILAGRAFTRDEDLIEDARVAIVSQQLARIVDPTGNALGRSISFPLDGEPVRALIVGVVEDVRFDNLEAAAAPAVYVPYRQEASRHVGFAIRTTAEPASLESAVRAAIRSTDGTQELPVWAFRPMHDFIDAQTAPARFTLFVIAAFAIVALLLTILSVYAFIAWLVDERRAEIGVRLALGAMPSDVVRHFTGAGLRLGLAGLAAGLVLSALVGRALAGILFAVDRFDPSIHLIVIAVLAFATGLASLIPARRAALADPARVLHRD